MAADFASLDGMGGNIPTNGASADRLQLTMPNSMITGTSAGLQQIGSPSLTVDSVKNLITIKPISTANTQILRYGQIATGFLGMAVNDGTNDTMFVGQDNTGATVIKIAKTGFDAKTASASNLILNSGQDILKVALSGTISLVVAATLASGATNTATVAHGLSTTPALISFINSSNSVALTVGMNYQMPYVAAGLYGAATYQPGIVFQPRVDATNLYFDVTNYTTVGVSGIGTINFRYYALQESIS